MLYHFQLASGIWMRITVNRRTQLLPQNLLSYVSAFGSLNGLSAYAALCYLGVLLSYNIFGLNQVTA